MVRRIDVDVRVRVGHIIGDLGNRGDWGRMHGRDAGVGRPGVTTCGHVALVPVLEHALDDGQDVLEATSVSRGLEQLDVQ